VNKTHHNEHEDPSNCRETTDEGFDDAPKSWKGFSETKHTNQAEEAKNHLVEKDGTLE
jgi:hypothetical protein